MNVNEYGVVFAFYVAFDISGFTTLKITFTKPSGGILTVMNPDVTAPNTQLVTPAGTFPANEYAKYVFALGDVTESGLWSARVTYDVAPSLQLISNVGTFNVYP
jgi:hypothetical protein